MAIGKHQHGRAHLAKSRDRAAVLKFDQGRELAGPRRDRVCRIGR